MGLRRWFFGTIRPEAVETDSVTTEVLNSILTADNLSDIETDLGSGGRVEPHPGTYTASSTVTSAASDTWVDLRRVVLELADGADTALYKPQNVSDLRLVGGEFDGNKANQGTAENGQHVVQLGGVDRGTVIGTVAKNAHHDNFLYGGGTKDVCTIAAVAEAASDDGFNPIGTGTSQLAFLGSLARNNGTDGFHYSQNSEDISAVGNISHSNSEDGVQAYTDGITVSGNLSKSNGKDGYYLNQDVSHAVLSGNLSRGNTKKGVRLRASESVVSGHVSINETEEAIYIPSYADNVVVSDIVTDGGKAGFYAKGDGTQISNLTVANMVIVDPDDWGLVLNYIDEARFSNIHINGPTSGGFDGINITDATDVVFENLTVQNAARDDINISSTATDIDLRGCTFNGSITDNGTRTRWDGVIGDGPLGGVDLSSTTGQYDGDRAIADGTSGANAGDLARWDAANSQWDVFQPATTV